MSTFDLQELRVTADQSPDADPVASQDASALSPFEVRSVENDVVKPMSFEFVYWWVEANGTTIVTGAGLGSADVRVGKVTQATVAGSPVERVQAGPVRTVVMGEPIIIDDVLDKDRVFLIFDATTPAGGAKIRIEGRAQPEEN